jgi:hypothetical protein
MVYCPHSNGIYQDTPDNRRGRFIAPIADLSALAR